MKRTILILAAALSLSACSTLGDITGLSDTAVRVAEAVTDENTSTAKGATAGMSSSDAANVLINRDYYNAVKAVHGAGKGEARAPLVEIEARDGQPITINAKSFKVYSPPPQGGAAALSIAQPREVESTGIKWFREVRRGLAEVLIPWKAIDESNNTARQANTNATAVRQTELGVVNNAVIGSQGIAGQAITTFKPAEPIIITTPAPAAEPTSTEAPAE